MVGIVFLYKAATTRNVLWLDISTFFVIILIAQTLFVSFLEQLEPTWLTVILSAIFLAGLLIAFLRFTLWPPREPDLFIDPISDKYGLHGHPDITPPDE